MSKRWMTTAISAVAITLAACGGGGDKDSATDVASADTPAKEAPSEDRGGGGLPDPCSVFSTADIAAAFGGDPGPGKESGGGSRKVCQYAPGSAIVAVSAADQYQPSIDMARANGSTCNETSGVGDSATFCNAYGQVGQLYWIKGDVMYDVTAPNVDESAYKTLAAKARA